MSIQYVSPVGVISGDHREAVTNLVSRGYAYAQAHVRGSHGSGGCFDRHGRLDQSDAGDMIQFVSDPATAPWTDGTVGLFGISSNGASNVEAAGLADREKTAALKAVVAGAPVTSYYDSWIGWAGVPPLYPRPLGLLETDVTYSTNGVVSTPGSRPVERQSCYLDRLTDPASYTGDFGLVAAERELRRGAGNITVPILVPHGFADPSVNFRVQVGFFDEIPETTRKVGVFGYFGHEWPDGDNWEDPNFGSGDPVDQKWNTLPEQTRADWQAMVVAWFDHYLKGIDSGVDHWPTVQVQDTDGQWRAQDDWPASGGPTGQLALGAGNTLGATEPTGSTSYDEIAYRNSNLGGYPPGTSARFEMDVKGRLELTGQPVADLWVQLDRPDAHIGVTLEVYDAAGKLKPYASTWGFRSAQHLDPFVDGRFEQRKPRPPFELLDPRPVRVIVPLEPRDLVVHAGDKLVLTIAGSAPWPYDPGLGIGGADGFGHPTQLSGSATHVTILHGCDRVSALRFQMPDQRRRLLNVLEDGEPMPLRAIVTTDQRSDAAGAATAPVCGQAPPPMT
jgi:predicted acyl esterase